MQVSITKVQNILDIHAILLIESCASIEFVSQRLDNRKMDIILETYSDITEKLEEDELKKFVSTIISINLLLIKPPL